MKFYLTEGLLKPLKSVENIELVTIQGVLYGFVSDCFMGKHDFTFKNDKNHQNIVTLKTENLKMPYFINSINSDLLNKHSINLCIPDNHNYNLDNTNKIEFKSNKYIIITNVVFIDIDFNKNGKLFDTRVFKNKKLCYNVLLNKDTFDKGFLSQIFYSNNKLISKFFKLGKNELIYLINEKKSVKKYLNSILSNENNCIYINT